jgi:sugar transferase (PEP-CTERM/EpsH1 system associated)
LRCIAGAHEIDLFTFADDQADWERRSAFPNFCRRVTVARLNPRWARMRSMPHLLTRNPLTVPYFASKELQNDLRRALSQTSYDRIIVYCSAMAQYVESIDQIPIVADLVDIDSDKWAQYASLTTFPVSAIYRREGKALRRYERQVCEKSSCVVVSTPREARLAREISPSANVHVIPNGVDTEYFKPATTRFEGGPPVVGFTGDMSYFPNQDAVKYFAHKVLPVIRRSVPDARFLIVGRNPTSAVRRLAVIEGVEVTGSVPDIRAHLARMRVSVAPFSIACGIQNKILEAMSYELPVVTSSRTAQGLTPDAAAAVDRADDPEDMAAKIVRLLEHPRLAWEKGKENRLVVAADYNWERSLDHFRQIVENPARTATPEVAASGPS